MRTDGNGNVGRELEANVVSVGRSWLVEDDARRLVQLDHDLRGGPVHALAGAHVERHALPAPGVDEQMQSRIGRYARIGCNAGLAVVAAELSEYHLCRRERAHG